MDRPNHVQFPSRPVPEVAGVPLGGVGTRLGEACFAAPENRPSASEARQTAAHYMAMNKDWQTKTLLNTPGK